MKREHLRKLRRSEKKLKGKARAKFQMPEPLTISPMNINYGQVWNKLARFGQSLIDVANAMRQVQRAVIRQANGEHQGS